MTHATPIKGAEKLPSRWAFTEDLAGYDMPIRLEGEIGDVIVRGTIPDCVDGTFYRVVPLGGHGVVSAFRIHKGRVDFKIRYVQNDRYKVERQQRQSFFASVLNNPLADHPCVRAVMKQSSNTNVIYWAGRLLALGEIGPPYAMDPDTLETTGVDPFGNQIITPAFTAHPKIDPHVDQLVTWGILRGSDLVSYSIDRQGMVKNEHRIKPPRPTSCHDIAMTENWVVFCTWPTQLNFDGKPGEPVAAWNMDLPLTFIVAPRRPDQPLAGSGWKPYESRIYHHPVNSAIIHTAGAWEEGSKIFFEGTYPHDTIFPFWPRAGQRNALKKTVVDLVRLEIDTNSPTDTQIPDPAVLVDIPNEFPRIDERFFCKKYDFIFMNVYKPESNGVDLTKHIFAGLNSTAMLDKRSGELKIYSPGPNCRCQEPVFIPRSDDAPEADGYIIFAVDRLDINLTNVVILDSRDFGDPVAVIELPLRMRAQIHGNWVDARELNGRPLVADPPLHNMVWRHGPSQPGILTPVQQRA
ncbi:lignostilbene dioxygenase family protein [Halenospora varia]|nr:lignostilbene dioxygenase family protein [Halenospora varia]